MGYSKRKYRIWYFCKKKKNVGILVNYETSRKLLLNLKLHSLLGKKKSLKPHSHSHSRDITFITLIFYFQISQAVSLFSFPSQSFRSRQ